MMPLKYDIVKYIFFGVFFEFLFIGTEVNLALKNECPKVVDTTPTEGVRLSDAPMPFLQAGNCLLG